MYILKAQRLLASGACKIARARWRSSDCWLYFVPVSYISGNWHTSLQRLNFHCERQGGQGTYTNKNMIGLRTVEICSGQCGCVFDLRVFLSIRYAMAMNDGVRKYGMSPHSDQSKNVIVHLAVLCCAVLCYVVLRDGVTSYRYPSRQYELDCTTTARGYRRTHIPM